MGMYDYILGGNQSSGGAYDDILNDAEPKKQDSALTRGITQANSARKTFGALATGDYDAAAKLATERDAYQRANPGTPEGNQLMSAWEKGDGIIGGIKGVAGEFAKDWREAPSGISALQATGKNLSAMGGGIVEQIPNMVMPMAGMLAGGAAGSLAGPVGTVGGAFAGAATGNTAAESAEQVDRAIRGAGINPQDTGAVRSFLEQDAGGILGKSAIKGGIIGAVDTATMGIGGKMLRAPVNAATDRAIASLGINAADKAAVTAAREQIGKAVLADPIYQASQKGAQALARNATVGALEPVGEFAGEYLGQGAATGDWDTKGAMLEALSSLGQSGITYAGQKIYQSATSPLRGVKADGQAAPQNTPDIPPDVTLITEPTPLQQRIDAMLGLDSSRMDDKNRKQYETDLVAAFNEPIGIRLDADQKEVPFTMGEYLDAQVSANDAVRARAQIPAQSANQQANTRLAQLADEEAQQHAAITQDLVQSASQGGALSQAALTGIQTGATQMPVHPERAAIEQQMLLDEAAQAELAPIERLMRKLPEARVQSIAQNPNANENYRKAAIADLQRRMTTQAQPTTTEPLQQTATQFTPPNPSIKMLQAQLDKSEPFSETSQRLIGLLQTAVANDAKKAIDNGEMPVYRVTDHVSVAIHPSAQNPGMVQVTRYTKDGVIGDSQYNNIDDAVTQEGLTHKPRIDSSDAVKAIEQSISAEAEYQQRKSAQAQNIPTNPVTNVQTGAAASHNDGFINLAAYNITTPDPLKPNDVPLSVDDALFELDVLQERADKGKLTPHAFAQSGISARLDIAQVMTINEQITAGDTSFIGALKARLEQSAAPKGQGVSNDVRMQAVQAGAPQAIMQTGVSNQSNGQRQESVQGATVAVPAGQVDVTAAPVPNADSGIGVGGKQGSSIVKRDLSGLAARDDLVGAIMRITRNKGISEKEALDSTGGKAGSDNPKLIGLFKNGGWEIDETLVDNLREDGYFFDSPQKIKDALREIASGEKVVSVSRMEEDADAKSEAERKDYYQKRAEELGLKKVGGRRTLENVVAEVEAKEAEIAANEKEISELEAREERAAIQASEISDAIYKEGSDLTEADLMQWLGGQIEYSQDEINEADSRQSEIESRRAQANAGYDTEEQAQGSRAEGAGTGTAESGTRQDEGFGLAGQTNEQAAEQFAQQKAAKEKEAADKKAAEAKAKADAEANDFRLAGSDRAADVAVAGGQTGLFDTKSVRGEIGKSLTKEERKATLKTLVDVYRQNRAPKEFKGLDANGNERYGYAYSPEFFIKSDITGAMVRYYVTLPDGRVAHPTELFSDYTQSDIDAALQKEIDAEREQERNNNSERERLLSLTAPTINEANGKFNHAQRFAEDRDSIVPALLTNGELYLRSRPENADKAASLLGEGWRVEAQQEVKPAPAKYAGPADVSSRSGQMELANRAGTIAALKGMNEQLRKIAPNEAWADRNIEDAQNLDALRDQISQALVDANRGKPDVNPLRKELEELSGQELKDVFSKLNLAGKLMAYEERISALLMEDAAEVRAAISAVTGNPSESTAQPVKATTEAKAVEPAAQSAEQKIRSAFDALPSVSLGVAYPITVEHNGVKREFMVRQDALGRGKIPALHVVAIHQGRMIASDAKSWIAKSYKLNWKNELTEEGLPKKISDQEADEFKANFKGKPAAVDAKKEAETSVNHEDAGEELVYNKRNRLTRALTWADVENKEASLRVKEVVKAKVSPKPDYQAMIDDGMEPLIAHMVKQAYDSLPSKPVVRGAPTDEQLQLYITAMQHYMDGVMSWAKNPDSTRAFINGIAKRASALRGAYGGAMTDLAKLVETPVGKTLLETVYPGGWKNFEQEVKILNNDKMYAGLQPSTDEAIKALKDIEKGWPATIESWQRQGYSVKPSDGLVSVKQEDYAGKGYFVVIGNRIEAKNKFATKEEAEQAAAAIKPYLLLDKYGRVVSQHETEDQATEAAREKVKREAKSDQVKEEGIAVAAAKRTGPARRNEGEDISTERIKVTFGFKGVNFGNWMKGESPAIRKERQLHLNFIYDSFLDLADILSIPPKAMSLNGLLGVAVGAQGSGKALAHFVPGVNEINITRTAGAGALAHEWGHALDHNYARLAGLDRLKEPYLTEHTGRTTGRRVVTENGRNRMVYDQPAFAEELRTEILEKFKAVVQAMNKRMETMDEYTARMASYKETSKKRTEDWIKSVRRDFERSAPINGADAFMAKFDKLADRMRAGDLGEGYVSVSRNVDISPVVNDIRKLYKDATGRIYSLDQSKGLQFTLDSLKHSLTATPAEAGHVPQQISSDYYNQSAKADRETKRTYWNTNLEKFARAFDAFITDTVAERAAKNTYLSGIEAVSPQGEERKAINAAIRNLVSEFKTKDTDKGVALYSKSQDATQSQPITRTEAESRIKSILGDKLGKVLIDSGIVTFTNKGNEYHGATYKDGSIVLNLDALNADNFAGVFSHEGFHSTIRDLVGEQTYTQMMKQLNTMLAMGKGAQWVKDADAAIPSDTKAEHRTEEIAAYSIEQYVNGAKQPNVIKRWVESLLSAIRTAIIQRMPNGKLKSWAVNNLQPQDLANLAIAGLKAKARGQLQAQGREAMAFSQAQGVQSSYELPNQQQGNRTIDRAELQTLRRAAARLERPEAGITFRVTEDGKAIATGPKGARVPERYISFANDNGLRFESRRLPLASGTMAPSMPEAYRADGALYFGEMASNERLIDRTGKTRFSKINQTDTPAFKKWFGKSAVVDADGKPLVVYHGTNADFSVFKTTRGGEFGPAIYLTDNPREAGEYGEAVKGISFAQPSANIMPVYARIESPYTKGVDEFWKEFGGSDSDAAGVERAKAAGYDGIIAKRADRYYDNVAHEFVDLGNTLTHYIAFSNTQVKSAIGNNGDFGANPDIRYSRAQIIGDSGRQSAFDIPEPSKMDDVIYAMQDKQVDLRRVVQSIKKAGGNLTDSNNAYLQEELFHGRASKGVKDFLDSELRPLIAHMRSLNVDMADFEEYLWNRHAEEANIHIAKINDKIPDGGSGKTTTEARAYLQSLDPAKKSAYESLAKRVDAINRNSQAILVSSGLETQATIDAQNKAYKHYVPLYREDVDSGMMGTGKGYSVRGPATKRRTGSNKPVVDILANITMQREKNIVRAEKNRVSNALYGLAVANPNADLWEVDTPPTERVVVNRGGKDEVVTRIVPGFQQQDNVIHTRINGEDHFVIMDEKNPRSVRMAQAIKNLDMDQLGRVLSTTAKATRYMAAINTQYNPVFGVVNLTRDTQGAMLNLSTTPLAGQQQKVIKYTLSALRGIYADLRDRRKGKTPSSAWEKEFEEFQNAGGQTGFRDQYSNAQERGDAIAKELKSLDRNWALKRSGAVFDWLSDYNETMENAVRLASFKAAKEHGMSVEQAASLAKNLTVNFNRKGQVATQMGALYAFFNASVQGTARLAETMAGPMGKKILYGGLLLGSMQAMLLAAAGMGDDEPPEFVRERSLIIPIGDGKYVSIPMPLGFHVIPNLSRIPTEFVMSGFKDPAKRIADMFGLFADTFNPIGNAGLSLQTIAPTVIDPLAALSENKDWTGKPIAKLDRDSLNQTPGYLRAKDTATTWSKGISYALNLLSGGTDYKKGLFSPTPDQLDYLIGQATGGVGREAAKTEQTISSMVSGEELPIYKVPLVGRFVGDTTGQSAEGGKFYSAIQRINEHENEIKGLRKEKNPEAIREYLKDNPEAMLVMGANHVERDIQKLKTMKREAVKKDDTERVKAIELQITNRMRMFNDRVRSLSEKNAA